MPFTLDPRLHKDCHLMAESDRSLWLLLNNSHFPWLIIVPKTTQTELYMLTPQEQHALQQDSNLLSEFLTTHFCCDKLNVASIGNIVEQMHLHIIARTKSDLCWPGVVWGTTHKQPYKIEDVIEIQNKLKLFCQQKMITLFEFAPPQ
ncbi:HIT family protein [Psychromonas sp. MME2]|uniref:HIT family protein n=1 Tax=unclassified Psychromonas TaxID=2614957 RepID=UPI00339CCDF9